MQNQPHSEGTGMYSRSPFWRRLCPGYISFPAALWAMHVTEIAP